MKKNVFDWSKVLTHKQKRALLDAIFNELQKINSALRDLICKDGVEIKNSGMYITKNGKIEVDYKLGDGEYQDITWSKRILEGEELERLLEKNNITPKDIRTIKKELIFKV